MLTCGAPQQWRPAASSSHSPLSPRCPPRHPARKSDSKHQVSFLRPWAAKHSTEGSLWAPISLQGKNGPALRLSYASVRDTVQDLEKHSALLPTRTSDQFHCLSEGPLERCQRVCQREWEESCPKFPRKGQGREPRRRRGEGGTPGFGARLWGHLWLDFCYLRVKGNTLHRCPFL